MGNFKKFQSQKLILNFSNILIFSETLKNREDVKKLWGILRKSTYYKKQYIAMRR